MSSGKSRRIGLALAFAVIAVVAAFNLGQVVRETPPPSRIPPEVPANPVMRQEQRLAAVRGALQRHGVRGKIGYLGELPADRIAGDFHASERYFLTQFALVPWVLDVHLERHGWAVANLGERSPAEPLPGNFKIVEDFGAGVLLLRQPPP
jgi:hypothetical protein